MNVIFTNNFLNYFRGSFLRISSKNLPADKLDFGVTYYQFP